MAAHGLHRSDSALGSFLRRKKAHLGAPKAITATAHKLTRLIYSMLRYGHDTTQASCWRKQPIAGRPGSEESQAQAVVNWLL